MNKVLAFDVYGTLIDVHGVVDRLHVMVGNLAHEFSNQWRAKQLEYTFRRAAMGGAKQYRNFAECTRAALAYTNELLQANLNQPQQEELLAMYGVLPAFAEVPAVLAQLHTEGHACWAFSNGTLAGVTGLMEYAGVKDQLDGLFSVDGLQTFKPDPLVYNTFADQNASGDANRCVLISSNPFDVIGAKACGWYAVWVQRTAANVFDSWEYSPDVTIASLDRLAAALEQLD